MYRKNKNFGKSARAPEPIPYQAWREALICADIFREGSCRKAGHPYDLPILRPIHNLIIGFIDPTRMNFSILLGLILPRNKFILNLQYKKEWIFPNRSVYRDPTPLSNLARNADIIPTKIKNIDPLKSNAKGNTDGL
uniref:Uncharacterized protein n=1 Tax=Candidatus Kentrum sp. SD TaxID=2126332 RepID=A0A450YVV0_9GAMM|nr:MAG: hypothetical protein BECKSD772F_GA0070984_12413 [Candidatus Kentron sp. SD]VFK49746.1 MAG: hypothetical protein BECKSD772E_GA0070983_12293 [Candidatus Kentron sp. SD]VFK81087.1 MAG: hypothetical protein BECKSD772D_GA0070982_12173 [Candidatus Kentron sp. SD]